MENTLSKIILDHIGQKLKFIFLNIFTDLKRPLSFSQTLKSFLKKRKKKQKTQFHRKEVVKPNVKESLQSQYLKYFSEFAIEFSTLS